MIAKSKPVDAASQEQTLQEMQKKLEDSEKSVKDLKVEIEKEKEVITFILYACMYVWMDGRN